jgi:hypothetical protein
MAAAIRFILLKSLTVNRVYVFLICRYRHSDPKFRSPSFDPSSLVLYVFYLLPQFIICILLSCCDFPFISFSSHYPVSCSSSSCYFYFFLSLTKFYSRILVSSLSFMLSTFSYSYLFSFTLFHTTNIQLAVVYFFQFPFIALSV